MMVRRMPRGDMAVLSDAPSVNGHRPSADVLFHSVAQEFGPSAVGIIMTGMGKTARKVSAPSRNSGGMTIAQSEDTCVVGGMPRSAILKGYAQKIVPLDGVASFLVNQYTRSVRFPKKWTRQTSLKKLIGKRKATRRPKRKDTCFLKSHLTVRREGVAVWP